MCTSTSVCCHQNAMGGPRFMQQHAQLLQPSGTEADLRKLQGFSSRLAQNKSICRKATACHGYSARCVLQAALGSVRFLTIPKPRVLQLTYTGCNINAKVLPISATNSSLVKITPYPCIFQLSRNTEQASTHHMTPQMAVSPAEMQATPGKDKP